jgi:magnesium transporter
MISETQVEHDTLAAVEALRHQPPAERAAALTRMTPNDARVVFEQLEPMLQQEALVHLEDMQVHRLLEGLHPDDRARLLETLPEATARLLLARLSRRQRRLTSKLLSFPEETAGRIMSPEYLPLRREQSVEEALDLIRREGRSVETLTTLPVQEGDGLFAGLVMLSDLVLARSEQRVGELMMAAVPTVRPETDQEQVAMLIQAADLLALPVVDESGRLLGLITVDDAIDVLEIEHEEDLARAGASEPLDRPYFSMSVLRLTRARLVWLLLLAVAGALTVNVLAAFEYMLEEVVTLSLFIPLLIGIGGNSGAQSATTVVRAMATGELEGTHALLVVLREARVGLLLGSAVAALAYFPVVLLFSASVAATVSLTLIAVCTLATLVGSAMPIVAGRLKIDPAVVSAPVVTTLVDATGLLVYFLIAGSVMGL